MTNQLSGGQQQRVALARALVIEPSVLLFDEPLSNLDAKLRTAMRTEIIKLHKRLETTFVYVTHDQTEAMTMGDRIVVMKDGIVQQVDTPENLYNSPCNLFVAGFIGSPGMNFIPCRFDGKGSLDISGVKLKIGRSEQLIALKNTDADRQLTLGIRPEDLTIDSDFIKKNPDSCIEAQVDVVEPLGSETFLYLDSFSTKLIARVSPDMKYEQGQTIKLGLNTAKQHIFDSSSGINILTLN